MEQDMSKLKDRVAALEAYVAILREERRVLVPEPLTELDFSTLDVPQFSFVQKIIDHTGIAPIIYNDGRDPARRGNFQLTYFFLIKDGERRERTLEGPELIVMLRIALRAVQKDHYNGS